MKACIFTALIASAIASFAQDKVQMTVSVSTNSSSQITEMTTNGIPLDYIINTGYAQAVARIKARMNLQLETMSLAQLLTAYPAYTSLVDTNMRPAISESILRNYAKKDVDALKTVSDAVAAFNRQEAAISAHPKADTLPERFKMKVDSNGVVRVSGIVVHTNAPQK